MAKKRGPTWLPTEADYQQVFNEQNPWFLEEGVPEAWAPEIERPLARTLWHRLQLETTRRFQLILGPRWVGKSTALYQTVKHLLAAGIPAQKILWYRLDHPLLMRVPLDQLVRPALKRAQASPREPVYLFFDELAYAKDWDLWLKTFYDEKWPVRLAGSSSSTAALRERRVESGSGRWEEQYLAPYLFGEFLDLIQHPVEVPVADHLWETLEACIQANLPIKDLSDLRRRFLLTGGFPELLIAGKVRAQDEESLLLQSQRILRNDAVERAIYKDIPQAFGIDDPMLLERMLYTLAGQVTGLLSPATLCRNLDGLSQPTFDRYLAYLERAFIVFTLPNYSGSEVAKQKRGRKLYFLDGAVRNAALQRGIGPLRNPEEMGLLLENLVAGHFHALGQQSQSGIYHWRDKNDEVDLVYDHPEHPVAVEIASSAVHGREGLQKFMARYRRFQGRCFLAAPHVPACRPEDSHDNIGTLPIDLLLLAISAQAEKELTRRLSV